MQQFYYFITQYYYIVYFSQVYRLKTVTLNLIQSLFYI